MITASFLMRLVIIPISTFGAIGPSGHPFISELSRRMRASVPYSLDRAGRAPP